MKVREIEMILSEMGAIDPDNPEESLGENETPLVCFISLACSSNSHETSTSPESEPESCPG